MNDLAIATILSGLILVASIVSVEFGISVAIVEIHALTADEIADVEDEEFEPRRGERARRE